MSTDAARARDLKSCGCVESTHLSNDILAIGQAVDRHGDILGDVPSEILNRIEDALRTVVAYDLARAAEKRTPQP